MSSTHKQPFHGTPQPWSITEDLLIVARDPFNGELSALNRTAAGVAIADLKASLRPRAPDVRVQLDSPAIRNELLANTRLILASGILLQGCRSAYEALAHADFYGPRRGRYLEQLGQAIDMALAAPLPAIGDLIRSLHHGNL